MSRPTTTDEIRKAYLDFFAERRHQIVPSSPLIPLLIDGTADETMLLTTAGMVQFKPYFTGEATPQNPRLASAQKCFRTSDIDSVGDATHLTFFEMLGNFSIGDYFKKEAIQWAWEFVTGVLGISPDRLWVTYYRPEAGEDGEEDLEARDFWLETTQGLLPESHVVPLGAKYNWWGPAGAEGPCGPCSEIHYSHDPANMTIDDLTGDSPRAVEIWNLVFTQFYCHRDGPRTKLPTPNIDTGMGLERTAMVMQDVRSTYQTDGFQYLLDAAANLAGTSYGPTPSPSPSTGEGRGEGEPSAHPEPPERQMPSPSALMGEGQGEGELSVRPEPVEGRADNETTDFALRVLAEHARSVTFLIADGVTPANEGRGYVLRRILRRAVRYARKACSEPSRRAAIEGLFLGKLAQAVIDRMSPVYPELERQRDFILTTISGEEEQFGRTLDAGLRLFSDTLLPLHQRFLDATKEIKQRLYSGDVLMKGPISNSDREKASKQVDIIAKRFALTVRPSWLVEAIAVELKNAIWRLDDAEEIHESARTLWGPEVFRLYDTYGFPPDISHDIARENGLEVDLEGFELELEKQRERSRAGSTFLRGTQPGPTGTVSAAFLAKDGQRTHFTGYDTLTQHTHVVGILVDGAPAQQATKGQQVEVILRDTPFYAEAGGQVGDAGFLTGSEGRVQVTDTQSPIPGLIAHVGEVIEGSVAVGQPVEAAVDAQRRADVVRNHTGTHLLHAALRKILGGHVRQAGSLVAPDRLRFDFTHPSAVRQADLAELEHLINNNVMANLPVSHRVMPYKEAIDQGALAFFGDKYGDEVRTCRIGGPADAGGEPDGREVVSFELCGGTHAYATGEIGLLHIESEGSVGAGTRRIEAVTGRGAEGLLSERHVLLESLAKQLQTAPGELTSRVAGLLDELDKERKRAASLERDLAKDQAGNLESQVQQVDGVAVVAAEVSASSNEALREMGDWIRDRMGSGVVVLGAVINERPAFVAMVTQDLVDQGYNAGNLIREVAKAAGGGGGGRPNLAQAGGKDASKLKEALALVPTLVKER